MKYSRHTLDTFFNQFELSIVSSATHTRFAFKTFAPQSKSFPDVSTLCKHTSGSLSTHSQIPANSKFSLDLHSSHLRGILSHSFLSHTRLTLETHSLSTFNSIFLNLYSYSTHSNWFTMEVLIDFDIFLTHSYNASFNKFLSHSTS